MQTCAHFTAIASQQKIDVEKGIIHGVSVITVGEAAGQNKGTWIDRKTLSQINEVAQRYPDGVKVKLSQAKEHDGSAGQIVGVLKNFRVDGDQERADLHLLKSDNNFAKIIEMAQTMPSEFGLSVVIPKEIETYGSRECLRCSEIYSIDLVEAPAANPSGLFSSKTKNSMSHIKYKNGKDGDHHDECDCKECMSKHSKKEMSAHIANLLGLSANATDAEIQTAFKTIRDQKPADVTELTRKATEMATQLAAIQKGSENALALSKKGQIETMLSEASRSGKVVPFDNEDLFTEKDGVVTIKMEPAALAKVINKLPQGQVKLSRTSATEAKTSDGKTIDRRTPEGRAQFSAFLAQKKQESQDRYMSSRSN